MDILIPKAFQELFKPHRYKVFYGGRGGGKSASFARALISQAMKNTLRVLCVREYQSSISDSVKRLLDDIINAYNLQYFFISTRSEIRGLNGSVFLFHGLKHDLEKIKSMEGIDRCWVEEANSISVDSMDILSPTIRKDNSEIWFSYNPRLEDDPVHKKFITNKRDGAYVRKVNYDENKYFPKVLQEEMEYLKKKDYDRYLHVWEGNTVKHTEAVIFHGRWKNGIVDTPEGTIFYYGADWGFHPDPMTLIRMSVDDEKRQIYVDYEAYGHNIEIDEIPEFFESVPSSKKWLITADSQRPDTISYMKNKGYNIVGSKKGAGSVQEGVEFLKSYDIIVHPRCKHVMDELCTYSYKVNPKTKDILPLIEDKNNHCIDPMRYAIEKLICNTPEPRLTFL